MARIDLNSNQPDEKQLRESIKQEIKKEAIRSAISGKLKHLGRRLGCLFLICLIISGLVSVVLAVVAKSGWRMVPVFSEIFYREPQPTRIVLAPEANRADLVKKLSAESANNWLTDGQPRLELSEAELTLLARQLAVDSSLVRTQINAASLQTAITPEAIEVFVRLSPPRQTALLADLRPRIIDQQLRLQLTHWQLGALNLPTSWGNWLLTQTINSQFTDWLSPFLRLGLNQIILTDGKLILTP